MIENVVGQALEGDVRLSFPPKGVRCEIVIPSAQVTSRGCFDTVRDRPCAQVELPRAPAAPTFMHGTKVPETRAEGKIMVTRRDMSLGGAAVAAACRGRLSACRWRARRQCRDRGTFEVTQDARRNGASCSRPSNTPCCARRTPSAPSPAR